MLGVVDDFGRMRGAKGHRVADHPQVLFERDAQNIMNVQVPALAHDRDRAVVRRSTRAFIPWSSSAATSRRRVIPKAATFACFNVQVAHRAEIGGVLGVGKRIAPFDIVESRFVEPRRDEQLVLKREIDSLALAAVAQRGVVNEDSRHGSDRLSLMSGN